jgi:hypothetical protein
MTSPLCWLLGHAVLETVDGPPKGLPMTRRTWRPTLPHPEGGYAYSDGTRTTSWVEGYCRRCLATEGDNDLLSHHNCLQRSWLGLLLARHRVHGTWDPRTLLPGSWRHSGWRRTHRHAS